MGKADLICCTPCKMLNVGISSHNDDINARRARDKRLPDKKSLYGAKL